MIRDELKGLLGFIEKAEGLKREMRHSWLSDRRRESVAEHTWRMSLMAIMLKDKLSVDVNLEKVLKMVIVHDLVEIEAGDVSALDQLRDPAIRENKAKKELAAIENIRTELGQGLGEEFYRLWMEFEERETNEAKFSNALDKLEVQIQHNQAPLDTWEEIEFEMLYMMDKHVAFDENLRLFKDEIVREAEDKMKHQGIISEKYRPKSADE
ncbi:haloacid dehalogenase [Fulvitalea axinellae]|uniref:Haloacid dehalogenase n=1 Tax=Fulvitalea axinellae TaxID=1182444 RepID=A0AAU9DA34_9BACT|nr:haloacid dehalogenase [Fulvitalea axinellae]